MYSFTNNKFSNYKKISYLDYYRFHRLWGCIYYSMPFNSNLAFNECVFCRASALQRNTLTLLTAC